MTEHERAARIEALIYERAGYVRYGKLDRADECARQLDRLGYHPTDGWETLPVKPAIAERRPRRRGEAR